MKYPKRIQITRHVFYNLVWVDIFPDNATHSTKGICDPELKTIFLRTKMSNRLTWEVFNHELLHAISFEYKIELPHSLLDKLSKAIARVLRLNKKRIKI